MNAETLDELHDLCQQIDLGAGPAKSLRALADRYLSYTHENSRLWNAVFEQRLPEDHQRQETYQASVLRLMGLVERAIDPLFGPNQMDTSIFLKFVPHRGWRRSGWRNSCVGEGFWFV
jgi:hypothetical protein